MRSHSGAAQGGINAALGNETDDSTDNHTADTVKGSDYLGDQDAIEILCEMAPHEIINSSTGARSSAARRARARSPSGRSAAPRFPRTCFAADLTGLVILHTLYTVCVRSTRSRPTRSGSSPAR